MRRLLAVFMLGTGLGAAAPSFAMEACDVPMEKWQPREILLQRLITLGWHVRHIRTNAGCYEVLTGDVKKNEHPAFFNPQTLKQVEIKKPNEQ